MKTSTRYLIVAVVMCIFLCIVMYLFIDSSKPTARPSGPCGKGGCAENTNVVSPSPPTPMVYNTPPEPVVNESNMFTTPVSIPNDDEAAPDIVDLGELDDTTSTVPDVPSIETALRAFGVPAFMSEAMATPGDKVPPIVMTEEQYDELKEKRKVMHAAIEEIYEEEEKKEEEVPPEPVVESPPEPVVNEYESSGEEEISTTPPPTPDPPKKRRGRPPTKGIHGKKSQQVVDILSGGKPSLDDIQE